MRSGAGACKAPKVTKAGSPLKLLRRSGCSLCDRMARDLEQLGFAFEEVDISRTESLERAYGEAIPVLMKGDSEVARAPQTERSLKDALIHAGLLATVR